MILHKYWICTVYWPAELCTLSAKCVWWVGLRYVRLWGKIHSYADTIWELWRYNLYLLLAFHVSCMYDGVHALPATGKCNCVFERNWPLFLSVCVSMHDYFLTTVAFDICCVFCWQFTAKLWNIEQQTDQNIKSNFSIIWGNKLQWHIQGGDIVIIIVILTSPMHGIGYAMHWMICQNIGNT